MTRQRLPTNWLTIPHIHIVLWWHMLNDHVMTTSTNLLRLFFYFKLFQPRWRTFNCVFHRVKIKDLSGNRLVEKTVADFEQVPTLGPTTSHCEKSQKGTKSRTISEKYHVCFIFCCRWYLIYSSPTFLFWELRGLSPNFHIHVSMSDFIYLCTYVHCTAPCIMFWIRAYPLRGEVGGGWALEFSSFLGPVKWHWADRQVPFHRCIKGRSGL